MTAFSCRGANCFYGEEFGDKWGNIYTIGFLSVWSAPWQPTRAGREALLPAIPITSSFLQPCQNRPRRIDSKTRKRFAHTFTLGYSRNAPAWLLWPHRGICSIPTESCRPI